MSDQRTPDQLTMTSGNDALSGERVAAPGAGLPHLTDLRLACEFAHCVTVDAPVLLALVECAEAAARFKTARIGEMSLALQALDAAVSKLEAL